MVRSTMGEEGPRLLSVTRDDSAGWYRAKLDNGFTGTYPHVWLRDNCLCSQCFYPSASQRTSLMAHLDPDITPIIESIVNGGRVLRITWPDNHRSDFPAEWLNSQRFSDMEEDALANPGTKPWGAEMNGNIPTVEFGAILKDDVALYRWLDAVNTKGLVIVTGAPTKSGALEQLGRRVAYLRKTIFGEVSPVETRHTASDLACTPKALGLHVDQNYLRHLPGLQMLHCIERTNVEGGESQFVDGMRVAEQIMKEYPAEYQLLTAQEIDFRAKATDGSLTFHVKYRVPTIHLDRKGKFQYIHYSDGSRAPYQYIAVEKVRDVYKALKLFNQVMYRPENLVRRVIDEGEIATFNNGRVLHARSAFTLSGSGNRHLECGYIDWDEAHSRMRVLQENGIDVDNILPTFASKHTRCQDGIK